MVVIAMRSSVMLRRDPGGWKSISNGSAIASAAGVKLGVSLPV